jgi:serine-type D-Ala-D-Ala carboxypeptidase/endopeptidase (penicillin-binding protein 4)
MIRRAIAFVLFALCLLFGAMGYQAYAVTPASPKVDEYTVLPLLSPRRVPTLAGDLTQEALLRDSVSRAIKDIPAGSICVAVQRNGRSVFNDDMNTTYTPASTAKLLTATAALGVFGNDHTFTTRAVAKNKPKDGVIDGPLYLVGGGDPVLMTDDYVTAWSGHRNTHTSFETLADDIVKAGVKTINGGIVGDDARFDNVRYLPSWDDGYRASGQVGPISALLVNQGFATYSAAGKTAADNPAVYAAQRFTELLMTRGVNVQQPATAGIVPDDTNSIAELESLPMSQIITEMLTESDNTTAEMVTKNLGVEVSKRGTFVDGVTAIISNLQEAGLPLGGVQLVDGSGLDRSDRVT